jgi:hypothetical protein
MKPKAKNKLTFQEKLLRFPPVVVRLLARSYHGPKEKCSALTDAEVAARGKLPIELVRYISRLTSRENVDVGLMFKFMVGCGADLNDRRWLFRNTHYMARLDRLPRYLVASNEWFTTFKPLIEIWCK